MTDTPRKKLTIEQRLEKLNESVYAASKRHAAALERRDGFVRVLKARADIAAFALKQVEQATAKGEANK